MQKLKLLELFGGIGACSKALEKVRIDFEIVDYVEIDKYATASFNAIHNTNFLPQDITKWDKDIDVDMIMHGSPCQSFSVAGLGHGGDEGSGTRSSLMWETVRIIKKLKPKYVVWENVKNVLSEQHKHNFDRYLTTLEDLGYHNYYKVLNAKNFGVPQNRERIFVVSIRNDIKKDYVFPNGQPLQIRLKDVLEKEVEEKFYLSDEQVKRIRFSNFMQEKTRIQGDCCQTLLARDYKDPKCVEVECEPFIIASRGRNPDNPGDRTSGIYLEQVFEPNTQGISNCLSTVQKDNYVCEHRIGLHQVAQLYGFGKEKNPQAGRVYDINGSAPALDTCSGGNRMPKVIEDLRVRKLTPKECWRLMTFDDKDFEKASKVNSNTQLYKQAGNSIVVNVLVEIFKNLF